MLEICRTTIYIYISGVSINLSGGQKPCLNLSTRPQHRDENLVRCCCTRPNSGTIEFDEFLDIMWDVKHAKGPSRGLLFSRAGVFLEGTLAAAQAALLSKRQQMKTPGGPVSHGYDTKAEGKLSASHGSHSHTTNSTASSATSSGEQPDEQEQQPKQQVLHQRQLATTTTTTFSAAMTKAKEAALSILPYLSRERR